MARLRFLDRLAAVGAGRRLAAAGRQTIPRTKTPSIDKLYCIKPLRGGGRVAVIGDYGCARVFSPGIYIRRAGSLGLSTLRAISAPLTGKPAGLSSPICTSTLAWSQ